MNSLTALRVVTKMRSCIEKGLEKFRGKFREKSFIKEEETLKKNFITLLNYVKVS